MSKWEPRWPIDPNVKLGFTWSVRKDGKRIKLLPGGQAPPGHPRRCQGTVRRGLRVGEQCPFWSMKGRWPPYCRVHGSGVKGMEQSANPYTRRATVKFKEVLANFEKSNDQRLSLAAEIDMGRVLCDRAVELFDRSHFGENADKCSDELKQAARVNLQNNLRHVTDLVKAYAQVIALTNRSYTVEQVNELVLQITRTLERYLLPEHKNAFDAVIQDIQNMRSADPSTGKPATIVAIS